MLLAIESATIEVGVALRDRSGLLAALVARPGRRHVETLHPEIEAVCAAAGASLDAVEAIAVDVGPGLFTGIRVGVAAAKAFAFALQVPTVACTSTDVLVHAARDAAMDVVAVVDMRRGEVAWTVAEAGEASDAEPMGSGAVRLGTVDELAAELAARSARVLLVGDGARRHGAALVEAVAARGGPAPCLAGDELGAPPVASLSELGLRRLDAGLSISEVDLAPVYLRAPDVRINWTSRPGAPSSVSLSAPSSGSALP
ncbi:MAG: peptidase family protein [Acidimicrobiaceae bacterium]|nr:peptidase family protein [Acidimicrobiaceae bacterium]